MELLETVQEIGLASNTYFKMWRSAPQAFTFDVINTASRPLLLSESTNTLQTFKLVQEAPSITAAVALGATIGSTRAAVTVIDDDASLLSPWNLIETAVDVNLETYAELQTAAQTEIERGKATQDLTLRINPRASVIYGRDYLLGDIITANVRGALYEQRLSEITITVAAGKETIDHVFERAS